jgi:hypothetical protein
MAAPSPQYCITQNGDVVVPRNGFSTADAVRAWAHYRKIARHTVNADIEEAADEQAHEQRDCGL